MASALHQKRVRQGFRLCWTKEAHCWLSCLHSFLPSCPFPSLSLSPYKFLSHDANWLFAPSKLARLGLAFPSLKPKNMSKAALDDKAFSGPVRVSVTDPCPQRRITCSTHTVWSTASFICLQVPFLTVISKAEKGLKIDFQVLSSFYSSDHPGRMVVWGSKSQSFSHFETQMGDVQKYHTLQQGTQQ